jgi:chromosome partitioning protein
VGRVPAAKLPVDPPSTPAPPPGSRICRIIAISNQKGGEGKTTTAVNLAASLAAYEKKVLLVDLDPQGNASSAVGHSRGDIKRGTYEMLLGGADLKAVVQATELPTLQVVPASEDLAGAEIELVAVMSRETVLARAFKKAAPLPWDFVILDCPPSLGLLTLNALVAADTVLIPMQAKYFSLEGLGALTGTIGMVRDSLNPRLAVEGIVFCMLDKRTNLAQQVVAEVKQHFAEHVFETVIPPNVRLSESPSHGKPVLLYDIESKGAKAYLELAQELLTRAQARQRP